MTSLTRLLNELHPLIVPYGIPHLPYNPKDKRPASFNSNLATDSKIYCGGLSALCQAVHELFHHQTSRVVYASSEEAPLQSTLQLSSDPSTFISKAINPLSQKHRQTLQGLTQRLRSSISFHEKISDQVFKETGVPTFISSGRVLYTTNSREFLQQRTIMEAFGIAYEAFDSDAYLQHTLLSDAHEIIPLYKSDGGYLLPEASHRIVDLFKKTFPDRFSHIKTPHLNLGYSSFAASSAQLRAVSSENQSLWQEKPLPEISTRWRGTIPRSLCESRQMNMDSLFPLQSMSGLFFTPLTSEIQDDRVHIEMQINSSHFEFDELSLLPPSLMIQRELEKFFIGTWKLQSSQTLWHDTTPPKELPMDLSSRWLNLSILENSLSGDRLEESK